jgi:hypothetical protein
MLATAMLVDGVRRTPAASVPAAPDQIHLSLTTAAVIPLDADSASGVAPYCWTTLSSTAWSVAAFETSSGVVAGAGNC